MSLDSSVPQRPHLKMQIIPASQAVCYRIMGLKKCVQDPVNAEGMSALRAISKNIWLFLSKGWIWPNAPVTGLGTHTYGSA